ncbi:MAG: DNA internalization-related competence protein ComEC/Rec2 [Deltaproteobacteria bacterium]|nr:DNA internalization-related competence protein ComEC/Rec2 [Deltaproteobacteria bacterium]
MRPLVPVLLSFIFGVVFTFDPGLSYQAAYAGLAGSFLLSFISLFLKRNGHLLMAPLFFFLGALITLPSARPSIPPDHLMNLIGSGRAQGEFSSLGTAIEGVIASSPESVKGNTRMRVEAKRLHKDGGWRGASGLILLTVKGEAGLKRGDYVRFISSIRAPSDFGNPGERSRKERLGYESIFVTGFVKDGRLITRLKEGGNGFFDIDPIRGYIRDFIDGSGLRNNGPLKSLVISDAGTLSPDLWEAFRKTGTAHILSISGLHVGIVALFFYKILFFALRRSERLTLAVNIRKAAIAMTVMPVVVYGLLAGFPVPTQRAVIMVIAFVAAFALDRGRDYFNTLALAALVILALYPYSIWDASFQLSFAAVFFMLLIVQGKEKEKEKEKDEDPFKDGGFLRRLWEKRIKPLKSVLLATLAAGVGTAPILAYHFNMVSFTGLLANLVAVPLSGAIIPLLLVSVVLSPLWAGLAKALLVVSDILFSLLVWVIKLFSALPYSSIRVAAPTIIEVILYYGLVISLVNARKRRVYAYSSALILLAIFVDWGYWGYYAGRGGPLRAAFISVGQGESELIEFPGGKTMLIDGGGMYGTDFDVGESVVAPFLWSRRVRKIDYMVLSHPQLDHMGGLKFIAGNFNVGEFWWNGDGDLKELGRILEKKNVKIREVSSPLAIDIDGVTVELLHPEKGMRLPPNDMCLVLRLKYGDFSLLFTGDITAGVESILSKKTAKVTILKAPHHGSRYSSTEGFLAVVRPETVIVSAGRNNQFGFPHEETLERYVKTGAKVFRTDVDGAVMLESDGKGYNVRGYLTGGNR